MHVPLQPGSGDLSACGAVAWRHSINEVLASIAGDILAPQLLDEVIEVARTLFEESRQSNIRQQWQRDLEAVECEQARLAEAIATAGDVAIHAERLRATEVKRRELIG
jgi:hypothetical protein